MRNLLLCTSAFCAAAIAAPAMAQTVPAGAAGGEPSVYDGDWLSVGAGVGYGPSYDGSDDYVVFPVPVVQGNLAGIGITPRMGGIALDFVPDPDKGVGFNIGPSIRLRTNRASQIEDRSSVRSASSTGRWKWGRASGSGCRRCFTSTMPSPSTPMSRGTWRERTRAWW